MLVRDGRTTQNQECVPIFGAEDRLQLEEGVQHGLDSGVGAPVHCICGYHLFGLLYQSRVSFHAARGNNYVNQWTEVTNNLKK